MDRRQVVKAAVMVLGTQLSASAMRAVLAGPQPGPAGTIALNADARRTVAMIADLIIPKTDTPGALEAGVPEFIATMFRDWYTPTERRIFLEGLAALDADCRKRHSLPFVDCTVAQQVAALTAAERLARRTVGPDDDHGDLGGTDIDERRPFFTKIKELTVLGYYTSEVGATQELRYSPVPARYDGDFPFSKVGRQWSS